MRAVLLLLAIATCCGCSVTYQKVQRPTVATMKMQVFNADGTTQWVEVYRTEYIYPDED